MSGYVWGWVKLSKKAFYIYLFIYLFKPRPTACGILVPLPGKEPVPSALGVWSLNHWIAREVPKEGFLGSYCYIQSFWYSCIAHILKKTAWDIPGGPVVKTSPSTAGGAGSIPGQRAKIPHASWSKNQNIKQKQGLPWWRSG